MAMQPCDTRHEAWPLFLETYALLVETLEHELQEEAGLPLAWFEVLIHLGAADKGRMRMNDLADSVLLSKSGVTRLVDRMERAGLVERAPCPEDRRVTYTAITRAGRHALGKAGPIAERGVKKHFADHLSPAEERSLMSALSKITAAQKQIRAPRKERPAV